MSFSVDDLRAFTLVAQERSVSRAAQQMGVAQQSVSERIRRLERRLGVDLFVRLPHGMAPSPAGYRLLPYAHRTLALVDEALAVLEDESRVRVRVQGSVAGSVVPLVERVLDAFSVDIVEDPDPDRVLAAVADGISDVALGSFASPPPPDLSRKPELAVEDDRAPLRVAEAPAVLDVVVERAFDDPVLCVATPDHPLATRLGLRLVDLAGWGISVAAVLPGAAPARGGADLADADGPAVALCTRSSVAPELADGSLVELDVVDLPTWVVPVHVAYRTSDRDRPFLAALRSAFGESHAKRSSDARGEGAAGIGPVAAVDPRFARGVA